MKNYYFAVTVTENKKHYSYVVKTTESANLCAVFERIKGLQSANICPTKKAACELAAYWNECYKNNGTYLFDSPSF
jgi:hypothetical protein